MTKTILRSGLAAGLACVAFAAPAQAATETDTFDITLEIEAACSVTAGVGSNIDLGTEPSTATDLSGSSSITVNCSNTVPYFVGLAPSNGDTDGKGELAPTGSSPDTIAYTLRSTAGSSGAVWGNTATTSAVGNGVAGTGNGSDQNLTVYVTVDEANVAPDVYSDTVTVTVNY